MRLLLRTAVRVARPQFRPAGIRLFSEKPVVEVKCTGAGAGELPTPAESSAGKEYEEYMLDQEGLRRFNRGPLVGPFGTQSNPTKVLSSYDSRIVGCVGGRGLNHEVNWFELRSTRKTMCVMCGQFFVLVREMPEDQLKTEAPDEDV